MEDKVFLDEAGLGKVGKVISKFYASKEDIKDLESLKDFVDKNNSMSFCFVTQEEWQSLDDDSRRFFITKTNDPYLIVALESKPNSKEKFGIFDDDPVWIFNDIELDKSEEKHGQPYLIVNLPTSAELNFNWFDKNGATGATYQYKIQLALGLRDYVAYYQIVEAIDGEIKYTNWSCLNDMYSRQWIDKLKAELGKMETEINHIDSKVADRVYPNYIVNDLTTGGTDKVLSAEQGKILFQYANEGKEKIANALIGKGVENVSKESSFSNLAKGIDEVKTGYGVGDLIKIDDLEETVLNVPSQLISSKDFTLSTNRILLQGDGTFYGYGDYLYVATLYNEFGYGMDIQHIQINQMNLNDGSVKLVADVFNTYEYTQWNRWFIAHDNLYLCDNNGTLHIYTLDGTLIKRVQITDRALISWQTDSNNNIYLINIDGDIFKLSPSYEITKLATIRANNLSISDFAIVNDNVLQVLYCDTHNYDITYFQYFSYNLTTNEGTTESNRLKSETSNKYAYRYTDRDGNLLFTNSRGEKYPYKEYLIKLNKKFDVVWEKQIETHYGHYCNAIDNCIYSTNSNKLFVFDDQFNFIWSFQASDNISRVVKINNYLFIIKRNEEVVNVETIQAPHTLKAYKVLK